ncbi:hypothetical protein TNCV_1204301 [Trichonephila clavipes]|nr:hypothetical protein TNCV_1204301 [Trichonephila clavipes]
MQSKCTVTYMVLKAVATDRRKLDPCHDEFRGFLSNIVDRVALETATTHFKPVGNRPRGRPRSDGLTVSKKTSKVEMPGENFWRRPGPTQGYRTIEEETLTHST